MELQKINKKLINFDPQNPRVDFDKNELEQLQASIEDRGQLEPVHLEELSKDSFLVNEGNMRVAAIKKSTKVDYVLAIIEKKLTDEDRLLKQIIIDTHRKNWSTFDRDKSWKKLWLMGQFHYDVDTFAKKISVTKDTVEAFVDRMNLGEEFISKMKNISASNITETKRINDIKLRKKVLAYADKKGLTRNDVRKLTEVANKVSDEVMDDLTNDKISIDDASNMKGMTVKEQSMALVTTKALNHHKKKLKSMISKGSIKESKPLIEATNKVNEFQTRFFKLSADLRDMGYALEELGKKDIKKEINEPMRIILKGCLKELKSKVEPAIKKLEDNLGDL